MIQGRRFHACALRGNDVFVIGGEMSTRSSFEIWNRKHWSYSTSPIGATELQLISQGKNLYLFGGWEQNLGNLARPWMHEQNLGNKIWKIDYENRFVDVGNTVMARSDYALFTLPHGFLTECQGMLV